MTSRLLPDYRMRMYVAEGDTFSIARMIDEENYDVSKKDSIYGTLLHTAVEYNQIETLQMLANYGIDINSKSTVIRLENTALHDAVYKRQLLMVDTIVNLDADIDAKNALGMTPLSMACLHNSNEIAKYLLKKSADPNIADQEGKTAYIHAKENSNQEMMKCLPVKKWSLDDDPQWQILIQNQLKQNAEQASKGKKSTGKGKKGKGKKNKKKK